MFDGIRDIVGVAANRVGITRNCLTNDAIYAARLLTKKYHGKHRPPHIVFLHIEKPFDGWLAPIKPALPPSLTVSPELSDLGILDQSSQPKVICPMKLLPVALQFQWNGAPSLLATFSIDGSTNVSNPICTASLYLLMLRRMSDTKVLIYWFFPSRKSKTN